MARLQGGRSTAGQLGVEIELILGQRAIATGMYIVDASMDRGTMGIDRAAGRRTPGSCSWTPGPQGLYV